MGLKERVNELSLWDREGDDETRGYNQGVDDAAQLAAEADELMAEMAEAMKAVDPINTGSVSSMDWLEYNLAIQKVRAAYNKYKETQND